jgi:hypothetical protein
MSYVKEIIERAVKTGCQTAAALIGTQAIGVLELDWTQIAGVTATATILSVLTSIGSEGFGPTDGPSLV